ncbi:MAG TPA: hypothetical protein VFE54_11605 [Mucilaginibacter sp.]|jgi:antitoxin component YwqK of YwqJK toxin-antitoxin module|nr:hypothetical protein [Mucilaginibacter sp.]
MKHIFLSLLCFISVTAFAQKMPDYGLYKVRVILPDKIVIAEINPIASKITEKPTLFYYWYEANQIHTTQGGFSGKPLNGQYIEYYPDKNLKEEGYFKRGLKNGPWKSWNEDGTLAVSSTWKNGLLVPGEKVSLWKKLNIFRKKQDQNPDTLKKPNK